MQITVADDERDMREYLEEALTLLGHQVIATCADGAKLVASCLKNPPELVVTDIKMPQLSGLDAAAQIYRTLRIPVIVVSAYHDRELIEQVGSLQIPAYLVKPIRRADLETVIPVAVRRFEEFQAIKALLHGVRETRRPREVLV